jgi:hypothetical protein
VEFLGLCYDAARRCVKDLRPFMRLSSWMNMPLLRQVSTHGYANQPQHNRS